MSKYNKQFYINGPIKFADFISNRPDLVHRQLFEYALTQFLNSDEGKQYKVGIENGDIKYTEIPSGQYFEPSIVRFTTKNSNGENTCEKFDLTDYWSTYEQDINNTSTENLIVDTDGTEDNEITKFNYLTGKATLYSRYCDYSYNVDFKQINEDSKVSNNLSLENTFKYKLDHK